MSLRYSWATIRVLRFTFPDGDWTERQADEMESVIQFYRQHGLVTPEIGSPAEHDFLAMVSAAWRLGGARW